MLVLPNINKTKYSYYFHTPFCFSQCWYCGCTLEHIETLRKIGCNRASPGVQDTNEEVQKAIYRIQPFAQRDELSKDMDAGTLQRNFQGYSSHSGADLYAFGMSGISNAGDFYWQNSKDLEEYYASLGTGELPVSKLLQRCKDDHIRKGVIMQITCRMSLSISEMEKKWGMVFEDYFRDDFVRLSLLQSDGFVKVNTDCNKIRITETGRLFLSNIAMCFDRYLQANKKGSSFSKTV